MKKVITIICVVLGFVVCGLGTFLVSNHFHNKETEQLTSQISTLNATMESIGEITTCYTVMSATFPGQQFTDDLLVEQSIPASFKNDSFASRSDLVGMYCKVALTPGTPITVDMAMKDALVDSLREVDVIGNRWPIGLKAGDYIDVRITYPHGEDFIIISHERVMQLGDSTLKLHLTEEQRTLYQAALVDFYLSRDYGSDLYFTKYVEPGLQEAATPFYSVPASIAAVCLQNPNIVDIAQVSVEEDIRKTITSASVAFGERDNSGSLIKTGRDELNSAVNSDYNTRAQAEEKEAAAKDKDEKPSSLVQNIAEGVD